MTDLRASRAHLLGWAAVCAVLFAALAVAVGVVPGKVHNLDAQVSDWPVRMAYGHTWLRTVARAVQHLGSAPVIAVVTVVVAVLLFIRGHRRAAVWSAVTMLVAGVLTEILKRVLGVDPYAPGAWGRAVVHAIRRVEGGAFPSGHTAGVAAGVGVAIVLVAMLVRRRAVRRLIDALALLVLLVVSAAMIFLGAHRLSEVIAGWLLGAFVVLLAAGLVDPTPRSLAETAPPLAEAVPRTEGRVLAVVLNPIKVDDPGQFKAMTEAQARESGFDDVRWWETTAEDTGHQMAHEAAVAGADIVMAVGGDGTIRAVCEELAGTGIPVGVVPAGTGNLLARNIAVPLYLRAAVDVALNGQDRAIDMVNVAGDDLEDATFLVMAGMGFDAAIMAGVDDGIKAKVGWLAYVWSALKALMFPAIKVEVSIDGGEPSVHRARTIVIGNVGHLQAGLPLLPDATIDDGHLDVVLLYPRKFLSWVPLAARVVARDRRTDETITRMTGRSVVVRATTDAPRQIDGDVLAPGRELRAECVHGRVLVRVPR